jgi:hypothetical protein
VPAYKHRHQHSFHTVRYGPRHFYGHHVTGKKHLHPDLETMADRRKRRWLIGGLVAVILVVFAVLVGFSAYRSASSAKNSLDSARLIISNDLNNKQAFLSSSGRTQLAADIQLVEKDANVAASTLQASFGIRVLGYVPYLSLRLNLSHSLRPPS